MNDSEHLRQSDEAAQRRVDEAEYLARNTRPPLDILGMLARESRLGEDLARALDIAHVKASRARFEA